MPRDGLNRLIWTHSLAKGLNEFWQHRTRGLGSLICFLFLLRPFSSFPPYADIRYEIIFLYDFAMQ